MGFFKTGAILSFFRELFVYHHSSLEFRAKQLAAMIGANKRVEECEKELLEEIAKEIYPNEPNRADILVHTVLEYVHKIIELNGLDIDELLIDIDKELKETPRFVKKINIEMLKRFLECDSDEDTKILQIRIIEFLENEIKEYLDKIKEEG